MIAIKDTCQKMIEAFRTSQFKLAVASHMQYDEQTVFNENNVTVYLAELEEYISNFITYIAQREKNPDAPISALSLDAMQNKEFDKGPLAVDFLPNSNQFNNNFDEDATTEQEEIFVNKADLFKKFTEFADKGYINQLGQKSGK